MKLDWVCKCGHTRKQHGPDPNSPRKYTRICLANDGLNENNISRYKDGCIKFMLDNLRYLESKYEEKQTRN